MGKKAQEAWLMMVLDSDIMVDFLRGLDEAIEFIRLNKNEIAFSSITEAELLSGKICDDHQEREAVLHLLSQFDKIPAGNPLVQIAGDLRRQHGLELPDAIIAASAIVTGSTLVSRNVKDFEKIEGLDFQKPY